MRSVHCYLWPPAQETFIAVNLLKRITDAGQLRRAFFICDRDELCSQTLAAFQNVFGTDAAAVSGSNPQQNARILIATYRTLDGDSDEADANFLLTHYPEDYFSHIIIDECHRSAWSKWSQVLHAAYRTADDTRFHVCILAGTKQPQK